MFVEGGDEFNRFSAEAGPAVFGLMMWALAIVVVLCALLPGRRKRP